jgi:hypothetical protein
MINKLKKEKLIQNYLILLIFKLKKKNFFCFVFGSFFHFYIYSFYLLELNLFVLSFYLFKFKIYIFFF